MGRGRFGSVEVDTWHDPPEASSEFAFEFADSGWCASMAGPMGAGTSSYRAAPSTTDAAAVVDRLRRDGFMPEPRRPTTRAVLDTFDGRIAAAGLRLELHDDRTLVLSGSGVAASVTVDAQPRVAADLPPGPLRRRLADILDVRALLRLVDICSDRTVLARRNSAGKVTASAAIHEHVVAGGMEMPGGFVVEANELAGYPRQAGDLRDELAAAGLRPLGGGLVELACAVTGVRLGGYDVPVGVAIPPGASAIDGFRLVLANLRDAAVANVDGTVDDIDPEFLHDLRVAVRRTRAVLANAGGVIAAPVRSRAREDFAWLGTITGPARDLDVYQIEWPDYTAALDDEATAALVPLHDRLATLGRAAHVELAAQLRSPAFVDIIERWSRWLDEPLAATELAERGEMPLRTVVARRTRRAHRVMIDRGRTITPATPAETVHELRKDAKKLRYLVECFGGLYDKPARAAFVSRLKELQDILGEHQDAEVHAHALRAMAEDPQPRWTTDTLLAIGQLVERLERRRLAARAMVAERFAAFDRRRTEDALDELLASAGGKQR